MGFNSYEPRLQINSGFNGFGGGPAISFSNGPSFGQDFMGYSSMSPVYNVNMGLIPEVNTF